MLHSNNPINTLTHTSTQSLTSLILLHRQTPRSTLFPTRRSSDLAHREVQPDDDHRAEIDRVADRDGRNIETAEGQGRCADRSEEHTSELQSLRHLVCRLLLEKKKHIN